MAREWRKQCSVSGLRGAVKLFYATNRFPRIKPNGRVGCVRTVKRERMRANPYICIFHEIASIFPSNRRLFAVRKRLLKRLSGIDFSRIFRHEKWPSAHLRCDNLLIAHNFLAKFIDGSWAMRAMIAGRADEMVTSVELISMHICAPPPPPPPSTIEDEERQ